MSAAVLYNHFAYCIRQTAPLLCRPPLPVGFNFTEAAAAAAAVTADAAAAAAAPAPAAVCGHAARRLSHLQLEKINLASGDISPR
jgi:hypothetical protein